MGVSAWEIEPAARPGGPRRAAKASGAAAEHPVLALQRHLGNQAVAHLLGGEDADAPAPAAPVAQREAAPDEDIREE